MRTVSLAQVSLDVRRHINLVTDILKAYQLKSTLGRLEFFLGAFALSVLLGVLTLALRSLFFSPPDSTYLFFRVVIEISAVILVLPLVIARLRDIGWHPFISLVIFVPIPFDPKLLILLSPENSGSTPTPEWAVLLGPLVFFVYLFFLLTLLFWKGRATSAAHC